MASAYPPMGGAQPRSVSCAEPLYQNHYPPTRPQVHPPAAAYHGGPASGRPQPQNYPAPNDPRAHLARRTQNYQVAERGHPNAPVATDQPALSPRQLAKAERKAAKADKRQRSIGLRPFLVGTLFGMGLMFVLLAVPITDVLPIGNGMDRAGSDERAELRFETPRDMSPPAENTFLDQAMEGSDALPVSDETP